MSKIEWTDKTWNIITGCTQISPACQNCYAKAMTKRLQGMAKKEIDSKIRCKKCGARMLNGFSKDVLFCGFCEDEVYSFKAPKYYYGWDKVVFHNDMLESIFDEKKYPSGCKVFVNSMSDTFHEDISDHKIRKLFIMMNQRVDLTFQVLTKRAKRMFEFIYTNKDIVTPNIQLGVTAENQEMFNQRVKYLEPLKEMQITTFVSCEPLLESIDISEYIDCINWVIVGGERANKKGRVMEFEWVKSIYKQCEESSTPFFFKQWGDCENKAKSELKVDDITLCEVIEEQKKFPISHNYTI